MLPTQSQARSQPPILCSSAWLASVRELSPLVSYIPLFAGWLDFSVSSVGACLGLQHGVISWYAVKSFCGSMTEGVFSPFRPRRQESGNSLGRSRESITPDMPTPQVWPPHGHDRSWDGVFLIPWCLYRYTQQEFPFFTSHIGTDFSA